MNKKVERRRTRICMMMRYFRFRRQRRRRRRIRGGETRVRDGSRNKERGNKEETNCVFVAVGPPPFGINLPLN